MAKPRKTNRDRDKQLSNIEYALGMHSKQMQELFVLLAEYIEMKGETNALTDFLTEKAKQKLESEQSDSTNGSTPPSTLQAS